MTNQPAYVVVPFERHGAYLGPRPAFLCHAPAQAQHVARQVAAAVAGVAILERTVDPETGDDRDRVIAQFGAVPPTFPDSYDWTLRLN